MKSKILLTALCCASLIVASCSKSDTEEDNNSGNNPGPTEFLASTGTTTRVAVLEDFTGVRCGYCPDGHVKAKAVADANPGKFVILAVHGGSYASPMAGWANFTTAYGQALISQAKVSGYPAGTISRVLCSELGVTPQIANGYAMSRSSWGNAAAKIFNQTADVNIGAKATFDPGTRKLTVYVHLYYAKEQTGENNINVALVQDNIFSKQSGGIPDANNYEQDHVVRDFITGQWGDPVTETKTIGAKVMKTYTYTVPENYNGATIPPGGGAVVVDDLKVVAFVAKGKTDILNAIEVDVK